MITYILIHLNIHILLLDFFTVFNKIVFSDPEVQDVTHGNTKIMYFYFNCTIVITVLVIKYGATVQA